MAMRLSEAQQIVQATIGGGGRGPMPSPRRQEQPDTGFSDEDLFGGDGGSSVPPDVWQRYIDGTATDEDLIALAQANELTGGQVNEYRAARDEGSGPVPNLFPFDTNDPNYYISDPNQSPNAQFSVDPRGNLIDNSYIQYGPAGSPSGIAKGGVLNSEERNRVLKSFGMGSGGGSGDGVGWANLAQRQKEFAYQQQLDKLAAIQQEQEAADQRWLNYIETLLAAAPNLANGRAQYGGFGPTGGGTLLDLMQGGIGRTIDTQVQPLVMPDTRPADTALIEKYLGVL